MDKKVKKYIELALRLALKGKGLTSPNPLVGAVIEKDGHILATGYHRAAGLDHAEIVALKKAGEKAKGANLYVNLEPCSTTGRTPPCTEAIINSKIKNVYISMIDPNPNHKGRGIKILEKAGIKTNVGLLEDEARLINQPFIKAVTKQLPYVTLKIAESIDGKIASISGNSKWITSLASRRLSRRMRNEVDAILVGSNTVLKDNPGLNPERFIKAKSFFKVVLDTHLKLKGNERLFRYHSRFPVIIATTKASFLKSVNKKELLKKKNIIILPVKNKKDMLDLNDLMKKLLYFGITNVIVEGGTKTSGSFIDEGLVDRVIFFIAPKIIGGSCGFSSVGGKGIGKLSEALELENVKVRRINDDIYIEGLIHKY